MSPLLAAITATLAYTAMNILFKRHTQKMGHAQGGTLQLTAALGLLAPVWGLALALGAPSHLVLVPQVPVYWLWSAIWAILLPATTLLMLHLLKTLSLTELTAARKALVTLLSLGTDVFLLNTRFSTPTLLAVAVIVTAALCLPSPAPLARSPITHNRIPFWHRLGLLLLLSLLFTLQLYAYKKALTYQPDLLSHIIIVKLLAALACLALFGLPHVLKQSRATLQTRSHTLAPVLAIITCYLIGSIAEGYALRGLPLTILIAITTGTAALMAAHDLWKKDLPRTPTTAALLALILAGFLLLAASH